MPVARPCGDVVARFVRGGELSFFLFPLFTLN